MNAEQIEAPGATQYLTREGWLIDAANLLLEVFEEELFEVFGEIDLAVQVATGWPHRERNGKVIGQCFTAAGTKDGIKHVFISPRLSHPVEVLSTLLHELVHAADDCEHQHKGPFVKAIRACGLAGKPTATYAAKGTPLYATLRWVAESIGEYPHSALRPGSKTPTQSTRMLKLTCDSCGYVVRTTQKWLDEGLPTCHCGGDFEQEIK